MGYLANATYAVIPDNTPAVYRTLNYTGGVLKYNGTTIPSSAYTPLNGYQPKEGDNVSAVYLDGVYVLLGTTNASGSIGGIKKGTDAASIPTGAVSGSATCSFGSSFGYSPIVVISVYSNSNVAARITSIAPTGFQYTVFRTDASVNPGAPQSITISYIAA